MSESTRDDGVNRRKVLECMTWVGTGVLWTVSGGVPHSLGIMGEAAAAEAKGLTFLQISDSHVGFDKPANPNALGTLEEAIAKVNAQPQKPAFMIHTGDISHLSLEAQFDDADRIISQSRLDVHYVPGEHDFLDPDRKLYLQRYGRGTKGAGWYSFDANGVHFVGLVNVFNLKAGGMGDLGAEQLEWLEDDLKGRSASTPIVVFAHIPLWTDLSGLGLGHRRFGASAVLSQALRLGDRAQRPYPPDHAEGRRQCHLPHRAVDGLPAAGARPRPLARPDESAGRSSCARCSASPASPSNRTNSGSPSSTVRSRADRSTHVRPQSIEHAAQRTGRGRARRRDRRHDRQRSCCPAGRKARRRQAPAP